jgi:hypothetical protein
MKIEKNLKMQNLQQIDVAKPFLFDNHWWTAMIIK